MDDVVDKWGFITLALDWFFTCYSLDIEAKTMIVHRVYLRYLDHSHFYKISSKAVSLQI